MKKLLIPGLAIVMALGLQSCGHSHRDQPDTTNVTINAESDLSKGLDLKALGELLKKTKDAKTLEEELNKPGSINNVDLDGDGKVDYLKVTEYGNGNEKGLSITDEVEKGETQEIATIQIDKNSDQQADVNIQGNEDIYGPDVNYHSSFSAGDFLLMAWLFSPHPFYVSPWYWGYYPGWYRPYVIVPFGAYHSRMASYTRTTTITRTRAAPSSHITSPNRGKSSATAVGRSLRSPNTSQKSFSTRSSGRTVGKGGFGKSRYSSPSSSSRSFGSSRNSGSSRSFGSSSHGSSRSFGSSSRGSSSRSFGSSSRSFGSSHSSGRSFGGGRRR